MSEAVKDANGEDEALTPLEMLLYNHFRYLGCPSVVDPVDPEDCAGMAVEVVRFLRVHGAITGAPSSLLAVLGQTLAALNVALAHAGGVPNTSHRDAELDGCREALRLGLEAYEAAGGRHD